MTVYARIYQPAKTAMQSGRAKTKQWLMEYEPAHKMPDALIGWIGSDDTKQQLRMRFDTAEQAVAFAEKHCIPYKFQEPHQRRLVKKTYASNFRFDKVEASDTSAV